MYKLFIIGVSDHYLNQEQTDLVNSCHLLVGTRRFSTLATNLPCDFLDITPLTEAIDAIKIALIEGNVAVLASGDPLFFGIGKRLLQEFPEDSIEIFPALSSLQRGCALFKISWDDARIISLHGRTNQHLPGLLLAHPKSIIFTDSTNSPDQLAQKIIDYLQLVGDSELIEKAHIFVAEDIGLTTEALFSGTLTDASRRTFSALNLVCLQLPQESVQSHAYSFGLTEDNISHSRGLITKNEVRAATLHQLRLPRQGVLWDIGGGSGSLSVEAARNNPDLTIYTIEHKEEEIINIKNNIVKFGCYNIVPVHGKAPEALHSLPDPDRVFVGGSSGALDLIISHVAAKFGSKGGRLVINGVIEKTVKEAPPLMASHGFYVEKSVIKVTRTAKDGSVIEFNPITIMAGSR